MALLTRVAQASMDASNGMFVPQICGSLIAGEALDAVSACCIRSDGLVYMSNGTALDANARFDGFTAQAVAIGESVTLFGIGSRFRYGTGLTPGAAYFVAATAGRLDTAATVGGVSAIARAINTTDIRVIANADSGKAGLAQLGMFISAEQTGTGSSQNVAHGLGAVPSKVFVAPTDTAPATVGVYTVTEGAHDATNVILTVTSGKKFKVLAIIA